MGQDSWSSHGAVKRADLIDARVKCATRARRIDGTCA